MMPDAEWLEELSYRASTGWFEENKFGESEIARLDSIVNKIRAADGLGSVAKRVIAWLKRLESQATAQERVNRGRFNGLADSCKADASNYRSTAADIQAAVDAYEVEKAVQPVTGGRDDGEQQSFCRGAVVSQEIRRSPA